MRILDVRAEDKTPVQEPRLPFADREAEVETLREAMALFTATAQSLERTHESLRSRVGELTAEVQSLRGRFEKVLASISDGVVACDAALTVTAANGAARALGIAEGSSLPGSSSPAASLLVPVFEKALRGEHVKNSEIMVPAGPGAALILSVSAAPLQDEPGAVATFRDITGTRKLQQDLARQERLALLGQMAATVAHEIRNPLGGIRLYLGLAARSLERPDPAAVNSAIGEAELAVRKIDRIIADILTFARDMKPKAQSFALRTLVDALIADFAASRNSEVVKGAANIENSVPGTLLLYADPALIERALANLIQNALQAAATQVEITASVEDARLNEVLQPIVSIHVLDNGPGLSPEAAGHAFEPFFTSRAEGSGLGLAIVERIAAAHGGRAFIRNRNPSGADAGIIMPRGGEPLAED